jgi:hypothetical protein
LGVGESRNGNRGGDGVSGRGLNISAFILGLYLGGVNNDANINGCGLDPLVWDEDDVLVGVFISTDIVMIRAVTRYCISTAPPKEEGLESGYTPTSIT